jgi:hypothetical protein
MVLWHILAILCDMFSITPIMTGGPTAWPPCSPDLNLLNFYPWGHLKTPVYAAPVDNEEALHHRIMDACQTICNYPGISEWMWRSMMRCVEVCTESHGGHFEHLYMYPFSLTHKFICEPVWNYRSGPYPVNYASRVDVFQTSKNLVDEKLDMIIWQFLCPHYIVQICTHQMCYEVTGRGGKIIMLSYYLSCFNNISAIIYIFIKQFFIHNNELRCLNHKDKWQIIHSSRSLFMHTEWKVNDMVP